MPIQLLPNHPLAHIAEVISFSLKNSVTAHHISVDENSVQEQRKKYIHSMITFYVYSFLEMCACIRGLHRSGHGLRPVPVLGCRQADEK